MILAMGTETSGCILAAESMTIESESQGRIAGELAGQEIGKAGELFAFQDTQGFVGLF